MLPSRLLPEGIDLAELADVNRHTIQLVRQPFSGRKNLQRDFAADHNNDHVLAIVVNANAGSQHVRFGQQRFLMLAQRLERPLIEQVVLRPFAHGSSTSSASSTSSIGLWIVA